MTEDEADNILRKYRSSVAYPVAGEPFGYGVVRFKAEVERRAISRGMDRWRAFFYASRVYERAMKYKPSFGDYCQAMSVKRAAAAKPNTSFTREELEMIADRFQHANDPVGQAIHSKIILHLALDTLNH